MDDENILSLLVEQKRGPYADNSTANYLPRLLYVGDVAVESTVAGMALLYRLLQNYPTDKLLIVEGNIIDSQSDKRLPKVKYSKLEVGSRRLLHTRIHSSYSTVLYLLASIRARKLRDIIKNFQPEAVLTVAHGYSWLTAAKVADQFKLPLHLIIHDDWISMIQGTVPAFLHKKLDRWFGKVYRNARSRLCASPYMVEDFEKRYGASGIVLYPARAADIDEIFEPQRQTNKDSLVFAYAGSIYGAGGYTACLANLGLVLEELGGQLILYTNLSPDGVASCGLNKNNISVRPLLQYKELLGALRGEVDVLFVPMSFAVEDRQNMSVAFPSKLADYTAVGLPLLIWGPPYCSAVRWARDNAGVAEVVSTPERETLKKAVARLMDSFTYREALAQTALVVGDKLFSHRRAEETFYNSISIR